MAEQVRKVKSRKPTKQKKEAPAVEPAPKAQPVTKADADTRPHIVCLGASAGGLEALEEYFKSMSPRSGAAFVVILHLSPDFKSLLPELIGRCTAMPVEAAAHDTKLLANHIYIIPPRMNMMISNGRVLLQEQDRTPDHGLNLPIDIFLRSLASSCPAKSIAIILSGTGSDGSRGIRDLKAAGGVILVQTPVSARFDGMPRCAVDTGIVDFAGTPTELALQVADLIGRLPDTAFDDLQEENKPDEFGPIIELIRGSFGLDLSYFRPTVLRRRIFRRMSLLGLKNVSTYTDKIRSDQLEARALKQDMLISVTSFFRDPEAFDSLRRQLASAMTRKNRQDQFRVWIPGCATGEEVFSLAIIINEAMEMTRRKLDVKIFATDIDDNALAYASKGVYPTGSLADMSATRIAKHFVQCGENFTVERSLREMVIFAEHNLVADPPFTKLDLVSCRNLLIYVEPKTQEQALAALHFSLLADGTLFLGSAESVGKLQPEFSCVNSKHKIYTKTRNVVLPNMRRRSGLADPANSSVRVMHGREIDDGEVLKQQIMDSVLEDESRTAAILTPDGELIEVICDPLGILQMPKGKLTNDIRKLVSRQLNVPIVTALQRVKREQAPIRYAIDLDGNKFATHVFIKMKLLKPTQASPDRVLLIVEPALGTGSQRLQADLDIQNANLENINDLQIELQQTRESLQATIEELQTSNEEQQSTNEELVASNEELQSTNEELQSVNEELFTVNEEYQKKNEELAVMAADLDNLLSNLNIATLFLDPELRIRKFTPAVQSIIKLVDHDIGRPIADLAHSLGGEFLQDVARVCETGEPIELEVRSAHGDWVIMRINPYRVHSNDIEGVVVTFVDVTALKNAQEMTKLSNNQLVFANSELKRQREELEDLFSIVAHDLKRPIVALNGYLGLVRDGEAGDDAHSILNKATQECNRVKRMLDDLGHVSGMTRQEPVIEQIDLQSWLDHVVDGFEEAANNQGVRLNRSCDAGSVVIARGVIEEACINLLENAFKYGCTNENPRIDVSCRKDERSLALTVTDNGKGIDPRNHAKVFEPFRRLEPDVADGSGIGLLAAKRSLEKQGGSISLESAVNAGAKFTVRLPLVEGGAKNVGLSSRSEVHILLIEDDTLDAKRIARFLNDKYVISHARSLAEAESRLEVEPYDVVLLDLSLPDGHGLEFVNRMRTVLRQNMPVVVISGHFEGFQPESLTASIDGWLSKGELTKDRVCEVVAEAQRPSKWIESASMNIDAKENPDGEIRESVTGG